MPNEATRHRWEFDLGAAPAALWPYVSDTNRFNRDIGLPNVSEDRAVNGGPLGGARRRLRARVGPVHIRWVEEPFEWVRPYRFGVVRRYSSGPVAEMCVRVELLPRGDDATRLVYEIELVPRLAVFRLALPFQLRLIGRRIGRAFRRYERLARARPRGLEAPTPAVALSEGSRLSPAARERLRQMSRAVEEAGARPALVRRLGELVERGDDITLSRIRPYELADLWGAPRREALELCLHATRAGLLDFRWELLCPACRGASASPSSLRDVTAEHHCLTCDMDFSVNFDRSVEVTFRPNPAVRTVEVAEFCMGGPAVTPHVVVQQLVAPGEAREVRPSLERGRYRLRAHALAGAQSLAVGEGGAREATLRADAAGWPGGELCLAAEPSLRFENGTTEEQLLVLERTAWSDQAATAAEVTALQLFRDLFAEEALRPGEQISVGQMTLLFTDLRGSTQLYRQIGDAVAFGAVMSHFDVLRECVAAEGGSIVKTLGDAVMGAFTRPAHALRAGVRAQRLLAAPPEGVRPLALKLGIHTGPCIAVTLNGRLDYFGSNVNIAARLEPLSTGADCVISRAVRDDPKVAAILQDPAWGLRAEPIQTTLKGFDSEHFDLWRVRGEINMDGQDGKDE